MLSILYQLLKYLGLFVVLIFVVDVFNGIIYVAEAKRRGYKLPSLFLNMPFGLANLNEFVGAIRNKRFIPLITKWQGNSNRRTQLRHFLFQYDITTQDPENIKTLLGGSTSKNFSIGRRGAQFKPLLGIGIFSADGEQWKHARSVLRPMFSREQLTRLKVIDDHTEKLIGIIKQQCSAPGSVIDMSTLFNKLTMDTITHVLFGESVDVLSSEAKYVDTKRGLMLGSDIADAILDATSHLSNRARADIFYFLFGGSKMNKSVSICNDFVDHLIEQALEKEVYDKKKELESSDDSCVVLNQLVKETHDSLFIRNQMFSLLLAGRDTTASFLGYTFYELVRHPDVYEKLRSEILKDFGTTNETLTFDTLKRCTYLNYVLNEVLRVHPVVPINFRSATRNTSLPRGGGADESEPIFVQKGQKVVFSVHLMQHNTSIWGPDASEFKPERWAPENSIDRHPWSYLPFNGGPRICLGQQFALVEAAYVVTRILQTFPTISGPESELNKELLEEITITIRPETVILRLV